jgi:mannose-6-phosphate isomerase-like protein (cupin superfamily)
MELGNGSAVVQAGGGRQFWTGRSIAQVKLEAATPTTFEMFEGVQPPGVPGPPPHVHREYDEAWYVLSGRMQFELSGEVHQCEAGAVVFALRGTAHTFTNPGPESARMLAVVSAGALALIEALGQLASDGPPEPTAVAELLARHNSFVVGP